MISIDNEVKYDIKRAFSNDFEGPWLNLSLVPPEQQDKWWSDFVVRFILVVSLNYLLFRLDLF